MSSQHSSSKYKPLLIESIREIRQLKERLQDRGDSKRHEPIAIVGAGCRFPGADGVEGYWDFLERGGDGVRDIPPDRWRAADYYDPKGGVGKIYSRAGGFIDDIDRFDANFFGISPREAGVMDPQHRLLLEITWEALENAAIVPERLHKTRTGIYVGIMGQDYGRLTEDPRDIDGYTGINNLFSVAAGRLAYWLGVQGPAMSIDTACSSSLVAIHQACQSLRTGEIDLALAGGVNLIISPMIMMMISAARMISADGCSKTFDESADGYGRGEGCGIVILKRLTDARRDGDPIMAVIRGTAVNHDGRSAGLTVPSPEAQKAVIQQALADAGASPHDIQYLEAHGTGTSLGDPIEIAAAAEAYGADRERPETLLVGSVKTNFGHLEGAAGVASILKAALAIRAGVIPPHLRLKRPNPHIDWDHLAISIPLVASPWPVAAGPRMAGVSSFGVSGTNVHVILSEAPVSEYSPFVSTLCRIPLVLSAKTEQALRDKAADLKRFLIRMAAGASRLEDVSYTLLAGRQHFAYRAAFVVSGRDEAIEVLDAFIDERPDPRCRSGHAPQSLYVPVLFGRFAQELVDRTGSCRDRADELGELLLALADLYCQGHTPDWSPLFAGLPVRRIELPTYPFQRQRYWLTRTAPTAVGKQNLPLLHPLLHRNTSDFDEQRFSTTFSGEEFFLSDHVVQGKRILPGAAYLEMVRAALQLTLGETSGALTLTDVVWLRPVLVDADMQEVHIALSPHENGSIDFAIYSGEDTQHCRGQVWTAVAEDASPVDIDALLARCAQGRLSAADCYARCEELGLSYGPAHRAIEQLHIGTEQVVARLLLPSVVEADAMQYILHPSLLDGALQSLVGLLDSDSLSLPFAVEQVDILGRCSTQMWAHARRSPGVAAADPVQKYDIALYDDDGNPVVAFWGFSTRLVEAGQWIDTLAAEVPETLSRLLYDWDVVSPEDPVQAPTQRPALVIGGSAQQHDRLRRCFAQVRIADFGPGDGITEISEALALYDAIDHLVWILPSTDPAVSDERMIDGQQEGVLFGFRLIKALLAAGYGGKALQWTVLTTQTQAVLADEAIIPLHAAVHGLMGSLAKEYPRWAVRLVDLPRQEADWPLEEVSALPPDPQGHSRAWRHGQWYRQRLLAAEVAVESADVYRQGGCYVVIGGAGGIGEVLSEHLIRQYDAQLVWIGRRPADAAIREKIERLGRLGRPPYYLAADACDREALQRARDEIRQRFGAIHGLVHSAIVLRDRSLANMDEETFAASLSAKVDVSVRLAQVFGADELDFVLFFSSLQSFGRAPGQSNYAAGCTFKDAFGLRLGSEWRCPVKVMNWGWWGSVGIVASDAYRERMAQQGLASIEADEGMAAVKALLGSSVGQLALVKLTVEAARRQPPEDKVRILARSYPSLTAAVDRPAQVFAGQRPDPAFERVLGKLLCAQLQQLGLQGGQQGNAAEIGSLLGLSDQYRQWFEHTLRVLDEQGYVHYDGQRLSTENMPVLDSEAVWSEWDSTKAVLQAEQEQDAQLVLVETTLKALPEVLSGKRQATDVMFPGSSMHLVEGIYKHNPVADYFNEVLADAMEAFVQERLRQEDGASLRILEIGAGTGGTSQLLFERLRPYAAHIDEYCYTDLSKAFLFHAEKEYGPGNPYLRYRRLDVSQPLTGQGIELGQYDLVIATNVLHATANIRRSVRHAKQALKAHGLLLLNEISRNQLFAHLTFGLLEGWWLYEDPSLRIAGCPALSTDSWRRVLQDEGFRQTVIKGDETLGQQIVIGESDGVVRIPPEAAERAAVQTVQATQTIQATQAVRASEESIAPPPAVKRSAAVAGRAEDVHEKATAYFKRLLGETLRLSPQQISATEPMEAYGIDSILVIGMTTALQEVFENVSSTLFFEFRTVDALVRHFMDTQPEALAKLLKPETGKQQDQAQASVDLTTSAVRTMARSGHSRRQSFRRHHHPGLPHHDVPSQQDIAVIGLSGRYPQANDLKAFWQNLCEGRDCISEIPSERWDNRLYFDPQKGTPGKTYSQWGGFIEGVAEFDPLFFNIVPRDAESIDPQERLLLMQAYAGIEDAGYTPGTLSPEGKVGVFVGVMNGYYEHVRYWSIANRVSYLFDFQGPSLAVDTACSSSLTALHLALENLRSGTCDTAIVGGVNVIIDPRQYVVLSAANMLSSGGRSSPFGVGGDGFVDSEGVGAVVLKPLRQAQADGDHIYGVIKGSAINHGGRTNGYTVPNPVAQAKVIGQALSRAGVHPRTIGYVEAHGTGTNLGDPIEIRGLSKAFGEHTEDKQYCAIGSVKSNIGHGESVAGMAGLTKVLLQMRHGQLVPSLHAQQTNPHIDFAATPFVVQQTLTDWPRLRLERDGLREEYPRRAGVSSFGAGGSNVHVIIEEYVEPETKTERRVSAANPALIVVSAKTAERLQERLQQLLEAVECGQINDANLADAAYTLQVGREAMAERLALTVDSLADLESKLQRIMRDGEVIENVYRGRVKADRQGMIPSGDDEEMRETLGKWLEQRKFGKILERWCNGQAFDWKRLYGEDKPRRVSLPTYPFARERYWILPSARREQVLSPVPTADSVVLHPLLHRNTSNFDEQRFTTRLTGAETFLRDHVVQGDKVLPAAAYLEMAHAALCLTLDEKVEGVCLRDIVWMRPLAVADEFVEAHVSLSPQADGTIDFDIYSGDDTLHGQGRIQVLPGGVPPRLPLDDLRARCGCCHRDAAECYERFEALGLNYGPAHRVIEQLHIGSGELLARLVSADDVENGRYALHPGLLDGALQSLIGLSDAEAALALPFAVEQVDVFGRCRSRMWAYTRPSTGSSGQESIQKFDIDLCDDEGNVAVRLRGFSTRVVERTASAGRDVLLLRPVWQEQTAAVAAPSDRPRYVLSCGLDIDPSDLQQRLKGAHCRVMAPGELVQGYGDAVRQLCATVRTLLRDKPVSPVLIQVLVPADGEGQVFAGLSGFLQTVRLENPRLIGQLIMVDEASDPEALAVRLDENTGCPQDRQIRYVQGRRQVLQWQAFDPPEETPGQRLWKARGVYLISGGLGGLGRLFARHIAEQAAGSRLILTGRRELDDDGRAFLRALEAHGAQVQYRVLDVAERAAVERLLLEIQEQYEGIDGILHSAGVLRDSLLINKTDEEIAAVLAAKVAGLVHLDEASRQMELDCFICFSSMAAAFGNVGQADYAAANGFIDGYAHYRQRLVAQGLRQGRTLSVNWPLWAEGGMRLSAAQAQAMRSASGLAALDSAEGTAAFTRLLGTELAQAMVLPGDAVAIRRWLALQQTPVESVEAEVVTAEGDEGSLKDDAVRYFKRLLAGTFKLPFDHIEVDAPLERYGIDSILVTELTRELEKTFGTLSKSLLFEYQTLEALVDYFMGHHRAQLLRLFKPEAAAAPAASGVRSKRRRQRFPVPVSARGEQQDIAIIGLSGRYPQANDLKTFWANLRAGKDCITEIPPERWDHSRYYDPDKSKPGTSYARWGGFIEGASEFDPLFFNISPREAELMDPQERLFLQCVYSALEDAGYTREALQRYRSQGMPGHVGLYVGVMYEEYQLYGAQAQALGQGFALGGNASSVANRASYWLNLHGPSLAVDTMCSSSLTALHLACESLRHGQCELAIAGGVNLSLHPNKYLVLSQGRFASSKGRCESFGEGGDGYVPGEGVGAVLLKPLLKAQADGDHIYGVIKATALNHGGKTNGYTVPNPLAQAGVIGQALRQSGIDPRSISYLEAHGTGTSLGDPIEISGLSKAFGERTGDRQYCAIGSVKSNIGHCESAAGMAGLTKVLLQMRHGELVPSLHSQQLNPHIDFTRTPFVVQQALSEWLRPVVETGGVSRTYPRRAGLSSFGAGGSNAHVIVEEYVETDESSGHRIGPDNPALILLSAKTQERLRERVRQLQEAIEQGELTDANLADAAYTLQIGREAMEERLALSVASVEALEDMLTAYLTDKDGMDGLYRGQVRQTRQLLSAFNSDEDMEATIQAWFAKRKYGRLLEAWVRGLDIDWTRLYPESRPRRMSLPTYPFARERYWVPAFENRTPVPGQDIALGALHPLLQRNTSDLNEQRFSTRLAGQESFLNDHRVQGRRMLPGAACLEMVRQALRHGAALDETQGVRLDDIVWLRPVVVEDGSMELHVALYPQEDGTIAFDIYSGTETVHSQGQASVLSAETPSGVDLVALRERCAQTALTAADCYDRFRALGLDYGPAYQVIETLSVGAGQVLSRLVLPTAMTADADRYLLHPSLLDGALQSLIGLIDEARADAPALPFAVDRIDVLGRCRPRMWAYARPAETVQDATARKFDIDLYDDEGLETVRIRGFSVRAIDERTDDDAVLLLQPVWQDRSLPMAVPTIAPRYVFLCGMAVDAAALQERLTADCIVVSVDDPVQDYRQALQQLCSTVQTILRDKPISPVLIQVVVPGQGSGRLFEGLAGFLWTARQESARLICQLLLLDDTADAQELALKLAENAGCPQDVRIRYTQGRRQVLTWQEFAPSPEPATVAPWKAAGVYLISGGLGGLGRIFARHIAERAAGPCLLLTGRRELDDADRSFLRELKASGATVHYRRLDVTDYTAVERLLLEIREKYERLDGIVHSAGVLHDGLLINKTGDELNRVLAPKVAGLINLDEASRQMALDCFICFSSTAAVFGNAGQADYAAANGFMDAFAHYRNQLVEQGRRYGRTLSVNWPLWAEGGMRLSPADEQAMTATTGLKAMDTADGIQALTHLWQAAVPQAMVLAGDAGRIRRWLASAPVSAEMPEASGIGSCTVDAATLKNRTHRHFRRLLAKAFKLPVERVEDDTPLEQYGIDSVLVMELTRELEKTFGRLPKSLLFEHHTLDALVRYFTKHYPSALAALFECDGERSEPVKQSAPAMQASAERDHRNRRQRFLTAVPTARPSPEQQDIAIIGLTGRYPQANDLEAFWENLCAGKDCITEIPSDRWDYRRYFHVDKDTPGASYSKWGGFIEGVAEFDPLFFNISPREAEIMDPQERLFLQCAYAALEDAGYTREALQGPRIAGNVGLYVGVMYEEYPLYGAQQQTLGHALAVGGTPASVANRASYWLNLHGPSMTVNTMCSSSLTALHLACESLRHDQCEMAIAGGVNLSLHPNKYLALSQGKFVSSKGRCESFGEGGDGYVPGEGVGAVILKSLSKAQADGDHIYAVIKATALNHGGRTNGYTVPSPAAQTRVIKRALQQSGIHPRTISYLEAHGTGTSLGDPIEINGLSQAFAEQSGDKQYCAIGSVKSNIGHCESAAGIAGLTKILLQMRHGRLVPSLHAQQLNPHIDFADTPFVVQRTLSDWPRPVLTVNGKAAQYPRRAGLSSFGAGGSNAHVVIEEYLEPDRPAARHGDAETAPLLIVLSAKDAERLRERAQQLAEAIGSGRVTAANLADTAYTLQVGREAMEERLGMIVTSLAALKEKLAAYLAGEKDIDDLYRDRVGRSPQWLSVFSDEDLIVTLQTWLSRNDYGKLLQLWVQGLKVDWTRLHTGDSPRRVSLPTYPFARERYWLPISADVAQTARGAVGESVLHPLLHRNTSDFSGQRFSTRLQGDERFLSDHVVQGRRVLPGAAHVEMARAALAAALAETATGIRLTDVVWMRPVAVDDGEVEIHIRLEPREDGSIAFLIQDGDDGLYSQGQLQAFDAETLPRTQDRPCPPCGQEGLAGSECYSRFEAMGLCYGPAHRVIERLYPGAEQVLARLVLAADIEDDIDRYVVHPSLLDGALQSLIGFADMAKPGSLSLPFAVERIDIFDRCSSRMWAQARRREESHRQDPVQKFDIDLCNDDGFVAIRLRGLCVRAVEGAVAGDHLLMLRPSWQRRALSPAVVDYVSRHVLLCGMAVGASAIRERLGTADCTEIPAGHDLAHEYQGAVRQLCTRLQAIMRRDSNGQVLIQVAVADAGREQVFAGLSGFLETARQECPRLVCQLIRLDAGEAADSLIGKLAENASCPQDGRIRYIDDCRQVLTWQEVPSPAALGSSPWKAEGVYLITGGLGGLGRIFARDIAGRASAVRLILTGRQELDEAGRSFVRELETQGARVQYRSLDVTDRAAVERLLLEIQEEYEGLDGILHSAGVLRDGLLIDKTPEALDSVLAPKVSGLINLDEASRQMTLDCFICFSSIASVFGNIGQADYAAANGFMDAYAHYRQQLVAQGLRHGRTLSVNWPLWAEGGMGIGAAEAEAMRSATGLAVMDSVTGLLSLTHLLHTDLTQAMVLNGEIERMRRLFSPVTPAAATPAVSAQDAGGRVVAQDEDLAERVLRSLRPVVSALLKLPPEKIDPALEFNRYGFDSITLTALNNRLNDEYRLGLSVTVFYQYPTLAKLADYLSRQHAAAFAAPAEAAAPIRPASDIPKTVPAGEAVSSYIPIARLVQPVQRPSPEPIAIIGLDGRFPQADGFDALWDKLRTGQDCVTEVPATRWDMTAYYDPLKGRPGRSYSRWGGFIDDIDSFDALFFNISPREAQGIHPQERLFLQSVWHLLEGSGYTREYLRERHDARVGVYVGVMAAPSAEAEACAEQTLASLSSSSSIANRISYFFDFEGPSIAIDTMCSSTLMAIHLACRDLQSGECALAVAGGVNLILSPQRYVGLSRLQLVGSRADSRSFTDGDGYLPAETVGTVLLKPLKQAVADGDSILGIIKGTATHHSGRSNGFAVPNPNVQAKVMRESLRRAGASADSIGWVEASASGSETGDAIEAAALATVFEGQAVPVGSVKSYLGHPEAASGVAQLAKVLLQLRYRQLIPLLDIGTPNRQLQQDQVPFVLQRQPAAWEAIEDRQGRTLPRRALINSFAAGGTYVCAVIEEYVPKQKPSVPDAAPQACLFVFSAGNEDRLRALLAQAVTRLHEQSPVVLRDLAYTLQIGREAMDERLAVIASSEAELSSRLRRYLAGEDTAGLPLYRRGAEPDTASATQRDVESLIARHDLDGLARHWVRGGGVPWERLYAEHPARRIGWVTYPFAATHHPLRYEQAPKTVPADGPATLVVPPSPEGLPIEAAVVRALADVLGIAAAELPMDKPLHSLGYNSIATMALKYRLEAVLQRPVALSHIRDAGRTVAALVQALVGLPEETVAGGREPSPEAPVLQPQPEARHQPFPLTEMQEAFLAGRRSAIGGDRIGALLYLEFDIDGTLDIFRLNRAWNRLIAQHDMLRAVFSGDGQQRILPNVRDYRFKVIDLRRLDAVVRGRRAEQLREAMEQRVFEGSQWPLFDIRIALHEGNRYRLHFGIDELIVDGQSLWTLLQQWDRLYAEPDQPLPALELTFRDYVLAMKAHEASARYRDDLAYWRDRLEQLPAAPQLPLSPPRAAHDGPHRRTRLSYRLPSAQWQVLKNRAVTLGVSPTALLLSVFAEVLRAWSGSSLFTLVLTYFNRLPLHAQIRELIGPTISSLLFVAEPDDDFDTLVRHYDRRLTETLDHSHVSGIQLLRRLRAHRRADVPTTLPVVFTSLLGSDVSRERLAHFGRLAYSVNQTPQVYLDHQVSESPEGLEGTWDAAETYFAPGLVRQLFAAYTRALSELAEGRWQRPSVHSSRATDQDDTVIRMLKDSLWHVRQEDPQAAFPLSDQQLAYAFGRHARLEGGGTSCLVYQELRVEHLDISRLEQVLNASIARHAMLRTIVDTDGNQSVQAQVPPYAIEVLDRRSLTAEARDAALSATCTALLERTVPLGQWPYFTVVVSQLSGDLSCVHLCFDLMIMDSTSIGLLIDELVRSYQEPGIPLPVPAVTFRDYRQAVERFRRTSEYAARLTYWQQRFAELPSGPVLPQLAETDSSAVRHRRVEGKLQAWMPLKRYADERGIDPSLILLTAYLEVLFAWNGGQPLSVVVPGWQRLPVHPDIDRVIGDFTTLSWVERTAGTMRFEDRLMQVVRRCTRDLQQRPVSGLQVLRRMMLKDRHFQPHFPVVFTNQLMTHAPNKGAFTLSRSISRTPQVYLDNISTETGTQLYCHWDYAAGVYPSGMVQEMFDGYLRLLTLLGNDEAAWRRTRFDELFRARPSVYETKTELMILP